MRLGDKELDELRVLVEEARRLAIDAGSAGLVTIEKVREADLALAKAQKLIMQIEPDMSKQV